MCYGVAGEDCLFRTSPSKLSLVLMKLWLVLCASMVLVFFVMFFVMSACSLRNAGERPRGLSLFRVVIVCLFVCFSESWNFLGAALW